jgi:hypothetical protein
VQDIPEWKISYHRDFVIFEVMSELAGGDQEGIEEFLHMQVLDF